MSSIVVAGDTSGSVTLQAPAVAGSTVLTLPVATDTLVGKATTDVLTNKTLTSPTISGAVVSSMGSSVLTSGTAVASTSGTSIDFTGIPSWVKRITVMFNGVSTSGATHYLIQIGSGSLTITGYVSSSSVIGAATCVSSAYTTGFGIRVSTAAFAHSGCVTINNISGNIWVTQGCLSEVSSPATYPSAGVLTLSGVLDRVRITTVNGTDTFDAGSINIMYE